MNSGRRVLASACFGLLTLAPGHVFAGRPAEVSAPSDSQRSAESKAGTGELAAGGVLLGLGFAAELSGAVISARCTWGDAVCGWAVTDGRWDRRTWTLHLDLGFGPKS